MAAAEHGPAIWTYAGPDDTEAAAASWGRFVGDGSIGGGGHQDAIRGEAGLALIGDCLLAEASAVYSRLRSCSSAARSSSSFASFGRLRDLARRLAAADPESMQRARWAMRRDSSPLLIAAAGQERDGCNGGLADAVGPSSAAGLLGKSRERARWLCRWVLATEPPQLDCVASAANQDNALVACLRAVLAWDRVPDIGPDSDLGTCCLVWWMAAGLSSEVSC